MTEYPAAIKSFTSKTDKVDLAEAAHINDLQDEVEAVQTELGINVAGDQTDLVTRLARSLADNGAMRQGTSFPASPNEGDFFYRTDEDVMYIYDGSAWDAQGQSLSILVFSFALGGDYTVDSHGVVFDDSLTPAETEIKKLAWAVDGSTYKTVINSKFHKVAGVNTVSVYARVWSEGSNSGTIVQVDIGGQTGNSVAVDGTTPVWRAVFTVDVSSLTDETVYDLEILLKSDASSTMAYMDSVIGFAS